MKKIKIVGVFAGAIPAENAAVKVLTIALHTISMITTD